MCSHILGEGGTFIFGICLEKISRESPIMRVFVCVKSNGYQLPRSRGYISHKIWGGGGGFRWWGTSKGPLILRILRKWGGGWEVTRLRQQLWFFWQARLSTVSVFSSIAVFWCDFAIFDFRPCHCLMNVFSHAWISRL